MASALDASVTLEDVLTVVAAKRVPLAPELAGYLVLEIADGADPTGGAVEPRSVFIGDEGSVAVVRARRTEPSAQDAEVSARSLLARLLEAGGSTTPALTATARRRSTGGLRALATEIESALIPVNRSAGRRALARLAREVKRVTQGVGRNATASPVARREEPRADAPQPAAREPAATHDRWDEPATALPLGPADTPAPAPTSPAATARDPSAAQPEGTADGPARTRAPAEAAADPLADEPFYELPLPAVEVFRSSAPPPSPSYLVAAPPVAAVVAPPVASAAVPLPPAPVAPAPDPAPPVVAQPPPG
ncbi:MAG TPA: hypothetical protein PK141_07335, partial [Polyangiaceae bacterium]|nr:hypothetical protein [Polyangiaceae bacterium]